MRWVNISIKQVETKTKMLSLSCAPFPNTREYSCANARGILHVLSYPRGGDTYLEVTSPFWPGRGVRVPTLAGGIPTLVWWGTYLGLPPILTWPEGYLPWPGGYYLGVPPSWPGQEGAYLRVPPPFWPGWGGSTYTGVTPIWTWPGYPPPRMSRLKTLPSPILRMRALVIT